MDSKVSLNLIKNWEGLCSDIVFTDIAPSLLQKYIITVQEYQQITSQSEHSRMESLLLLLLKKEEEIQKKFGDCLDKDYSWLAKKIKEGLEDVFKEERDEPDAIGITQTDSCKSFQSWTSTEDEKESCVTCDDLRSINMNKLNNSIKIRSGNIERRRNLKCRIKNRLKKKIHNIEPVISSTTELEKPTLNEAVTHEVITMLKNSSLVSRSWTTIAHSLGLTDQIQDIRFKVVHYGEDLNMCIVYLMEKWLEIYSKAATLSKLIEVLRNEKFNKVADDLTEILYRTSTQKTVS